MHTARVGSSSPLLQRTCLCCGYRGEELQRAGDRAAYRCPSCGQDLYARPARSYAEMEGLEVHPAPAARPAPLANPPAGPAQVKRDGVVARLLRLMLERLGISVQPTRQAPVPAVQPQRRPSSQRR